MSRGEKEQLGPFCINCIITATMKSLYFSILFKGDLLQNIIGLGPSSPVRDEDNETQRWKVDGPN